MRYLRTFIMTAVLTLIISVGAYAGTRVDQGAPGHQGPWPVVCLTSANQKLSVFNSTQTVAPIAVNPGLCNDTGITVSGAAAGQACALSLPVGFSASLTADCRPQNGGTVNIHICNPTASVITPITGSYTVVGF